MDQIIFIYGFGTIAEKYPDQCRLHDFQKISWWKYTTILLENSHHL